MGARRISDISPAILKRAGEIIQESYAKAGIEPVPTPDECLRYGIAGALLNDAVQRATAESVPT